MLHDSFITYERPILLLRTKFFLLIYGTSIKRLGHKSKGKKQGSAMLAYSTDREDKVRGTISTMRVSVSLGYPNTEKQLKVIGLWPCAFMFQDVWINQ